MIAKIKREEEMYEKERATDEKATCAVGFHNSKAAKRKFLILFTCYRKLQNTDGANSFNLAINARVLGRHLSLQLLEKHYMPKKLDSSSKRNRVNEVK